MIEIAVNVFQLMTTGVCTFIAARKGIFLRSHAWTILSLASGVFFLGDLYWQLFLLFYDKTPEYSYIPYLSWYASYIFLILLLVELEGLQKTRKQRKILWIAPIFTVGMCVFYMQWGDWIGNIISAVLMTFLFGMAGDNLLALKGDKSSGIFENKDRAWIYMVILSFCVVEYGAWTSSCFFQGDSFLNPYLWFDTLLSFIFLLFPLALRKAVEK